MPKERRVNLTWQGICTYDYPFTINSYLHTCMDMVVDAKAFCNMKVMYHASLISEDVTGQTQALQSSGKFEEDETFVLTEWVLHSPNSWHNTVME